MNFCCGAITGRNFLKNSFNKSLTNFILLLAQFGQRKTSATVPSRLSPRILLRFKNTDPEQVEDVMGCSRFTQNRRDCVQWKLYKPPKYCQEEVCRT